MLTDEWLHLVLQNITIPDRTLYLIMLWKHLVDNRIEDLVKSFLEIIHKWKIICSVAQFQFRLLFSVSCLLSVSII